MTLTRIVVTTALATVLASGSAMASAATDALPQATGAEDAVITYSGTMVNRAEDGSQSEGTATITADCSTGSCLVSTTATFEGNTFDPLRGEPVAVTDGLGTFERARTGAGSPTASAGWPGAWPPWKA